MRLDEQTQHFLQRHGFDQGLFERFAQRIRDRETHDNTINGIVEAPAAGDLADLPPLGSPAREALRRDGEAMIAAGEV
ncbi:MAG: hypothetical protein AAF938_26695, partial [Myxococcota bacterium]